MPRPLIIGMNNPLSEDPRHALYPEPPGCAGHRLWWMLHQETGASKHDYLRAFDRTNLVIGQMWSSTAARRAASEMLSSLVGRSVVLLGAQVRDAFALTPALCAASELRWSGPLGPGVITFYQIPHPIGRNPWYNDPSNRRRAAEVLASLHRQEDAS